MKKSRSKVVKKKESFRRFFLVMGFIAFCSLCFSPCITIMGHLSWYWGVLMFFGFIFGPLILFSPIMLFVYVVECIDHKKIFPIVDFFFKC